MALCATKKSQNTDMVDAGIREINTDKALLKQVLEIYDINHVTEVLNVVSPGAWTKKSLKQWLDDASQAPLTVREYESLQAKMPQPTITPDNAAFRFIDLFAGIGGIRRGFDDIGGLCVFTSEWNKFAVKTYKANYASDPKWHSFNHDIREVTLSQNPGISEHDAYDHIRAHIPAHDVLLAGFPCQPFSISGVSKRASLGRAHGFECETQGTLFFDVARIIAARRPGAFVLENVKNLKSHDKGRTFNIIMRTLDELGYEVADKHVDGKSDPKIIDGQRFLPQHRERIVLVGFRRVLNVHQGFTLKDIALTYPEKVPMLGDLLEEEVDKKYILTPKLWQYLYDYAQKHKAKGNGFGYGLVGRNSIARTLSARYYKDGSEILVDRGWDFNKPFMDGENMTNRPRRLTPKECARLMGFSSEGKDEFILPVSDTQAYKQFGNSVVIPVFKAVARLMQSRIHQFQSAGVANKDSM